MFGRTELPVEERVRAVDESTAKPRLQGRDYTVQEWRGLWLTIVSWAFKPFLRDSFIVTIVRDGYGSNSTELWVGSTSRPVAGHGVLLMKRTNVR